MYGIWVVMGSGGLDILLYYIMHLGATSVNGSLAI